MKRGIFMYKRVSGIKFWLLGNVTFGIYQIMTWNKMSKNLNKMATRVGEETICSYIAAFLLGFITFGIYPIIWIFKFFSLASRLNAKVNAGVAPSGTFTMFLMSIIPVYSFFWMAKMNNQLVDAYKQLG